MVKAIIYSILFVLAYAPVIMAVVPPVKRDSDRTLTKRIDDSYGCYYGYCWSYCNIGGAGDEWCYTTKTYSQSYSYVTCRFDMDCQSDWKCAGPCALI